MMKFVRLSIVMMILSSSLYALEIEKLRILSNQYYGANPEAYKKSMEQFKIPSIPGSDISDPLLQMAFYRNQSNEYLKSLGENADLCVTTINVEHLAPSVGVLKDGRLVFSRFSDGGIMVWNLSKPEGRRCEAILALHTGVVNCLTVMPDGRLISGSSDFTVMVWNLSKPNMEVCEAVLEGHGGPVESVTVLKNGRLASGSYDKNINVWDLNQPKGNESMIIMGGGLRGSHKGWVNAVKELHDGRLVSGSADHTIKVWNLSVADDARYELDDGNLDRTPNGDIIPRSTPKCAIGCQETINAHKDSVTSLLVLPDGWLVSASYDKTIKVWDLSKPKGERCVAILTGHEGPVHTLTLLPDGRLVSGSSDHTIKVWDLSKPNGKQCVGTLIGHKSTVRCVAVMPDGQVVSGSGDCTIKVWNLNNTKGDVSDSSDTTVSESSDTTKELLGDLRKKWCDTTLTDHEPMVMSDTAMSDGRLVSAADEGMESE
ncbi:WD40 repeat domain-containing protein [Candidatus Sororendozoicomonas aggregata]|uniref:WD40 repeat domain-containing protein n=1 Tax=Candidatus Sororendozoicomonas aggregata TaxID=3073239 RepID=UPI002ED510FC